MAQPDAAFGVTPAKRLCDVVLALIFAALLVVPVIVLIGALWLMQGRPIFHASVRMCAPDRPFHLWKLRTMRVATGDHGVSGGNKSARITAIGRILRRTRLDETPQLWNILRGDMSFVGPRPPLPEYVDRFPALYARVLQSRPGLTGLATLQFHAREERLLAPCGTAAETDAVYARRCIPHKARLDLLYQRRRTIWLDLRLLLATLHHVAPGPAQAAATALTARQANGRNTRKCRLSRIGR